MEATFRRSLAYPSGHVQYQRSATPAKVKIRLMQLFKVPGLSIAVTDNFEIVWAKGYGVVEAGSTTPLTTRTLFQARSISKPVAAAGALHLVEQGKLALDEASIKSS